MAHGGTAEPEELFEALRVTAQPEEVLHRATRQVGGQAFKRRRGRGHESRRHVALGIIGQHPHVLAAAAQRQPARPQRVRFYDAGQAARHGEVIPAIGDDEQAEDDGSGGVVPHRRLRELHLFLGHELVGTLAQSPEPLGAAFRRQLPGLGLGTGTCEGRAQKQCIQMLFDVSPLPDLAAPPGRHRWQF